MAPGTGDKNSAKIKSTAVLRNLNLAKGILADSTMTISEISWSAMSNFSIYKKKDLLSYKQSNIEISKSKSDFSLSTPSNVDPNS